MSDEEKKSLRGQYSGLQIYETEDGELECDGHKFKTGNDVVLYVTATEVETLKGVVQELVERVSSLEEDRDGE